MKTPNTLVIILATIVAFLLTGCGPTEQDHMQQAQERWDEAVLADQNEMCDAYFLFGPADLESMIKADARDTVADAEIEAMVQIIGQECL